jgi:hypothetical protein
MGEDRTPDTNQIVMSFDERVKRAREASLDLYLEEPSPDSAHLLVRLEETIVALKHKRHAEQRD